MAQVVSISVTGLNGLAYASAQTAGFPTQGILIEEISFPEFLPNGDSNPLYGSVSQITVLTSSAKYYSETSVADIIDDCNAA